MRGGVRCLKVRKRPLWYFIVACGILSLIWKRVHGVLRYPQRAQHPSSPCLQDDGGRCRTLETLLSLKARQSNTFVLLIEDTPVGYNDPNRNKMDL